MALLAGGCVQRTLTVRSNPPGALVYLNGVEVGRTPLERDFTWYGVYDVELRKDGFDSIKTKGKVIAPWWQWVPIDFFAEFMPLHDRRTLSYSMHPTREVSADAQRMVQRAEAMRPMLESSTHTRVPAPATTRSTASSSATRPAR